MNFQREKLTVVFFSDRWALFGLHAALASLLANAKKACLNIVVFSDGLTGREKKLLMQTAKKFEGGHSLEIRDLVLFWPDGTPAYLGNMTANARIFLPSLLPDCDRVLYLDSDCIVQRDVGELLEMDGENPLKVVSYAPSEDSKNLAAVRTNVMNPGNLTHIFYSGFFLASLAKWREMGIQQRCLDLLVRLADTISCPDQVVLNIAFHGQWQPLDTSWNIMLWPHQPKVPVAKTEKVIWHLIFVPKPWYPLGRFAHGNFDVWHEWHKKTALARSPLSWIINYLTPRKHYMDFALTTFRLIAARMRKNSQ